MNVYEKLQTARVQLAEMDLKKSGLNKFSHFSYYELADFMPQINKILLELKLFSSVLFDKDEAILTILNTEKVEEIIVFKSKAKEVLLKGCNALQGIGAEQTYLRRYLYTMAFEIVEHDTLDAVAGSTLDTVVTEPVTKTYTQKKEAKCIKCDAVISEDQSSKSMDKFGQYLCINCIAKKNQSKIEKIKISTILRDNDLGDNLEECEKYLKSKTVTFNKQTMPLYDYAITEAKQEGAVIDWLKSAIIKKDDTLVAHLKNFSKIKDFVEMYKALT